TDDGHAGRSLWRRRVDTCGSWSLRDNGAGRDGADDGDGHSSRHGRAPGVGVAMGLPGALVATRYIEAQLFGVTAADPLTLAGSCVVLAIAGATASVIPAVRAVRVEPMTALRSA